MTTQLNQLVDAYMTQEGMYNMEGRRGVENMCRLARALGYKDPMYFGQLSNNASIGDLIEMLQDNSGLLNAMVEWVCDQRSPEFVAALKGQVQEEDTEETGE